MTDSEIIAVVQAHKDGRAIEFSFNGSLWYDALEPEWDFAHRHYRIKPEPKKPREFWIHEWYDGNHYLIRNSDCKCPGCIHVREVLDEQ